MKCSHSGGEIKRAPHSDTWVGGGSGRHAHVWSMHALVPSSTLSRLDERRFPRFLSPSSRRLRALSKLSVAWPAARNDMRGLAALELLLPPLLLIDGDCWPLAGCGTDPPGGARSARLPGFGSSPPWPDSLAESSSWSDLAFRFHAERW